jgi:uncharacterized protein
LATTTGRGYAAFWMQCHLTGVGMSKLSPRLRKLDKALADLGEDVLLLSQVDGLIAGVIVCPDLILPGEWLPLIWGGDGDDGAVFDDMLQARQIMAMVMEHYNAVSDGLMPQERYGPLFDVGTRNGDVLWEIWIAGFETAMKLRPRSWGEILECDDKDAVTAISGLIALAAISRGESILSNEAQESLAAGAPDLILHWVRTLNRWRLERHGTPGAAAPVAGGKVGRNDPCPCGSGKKHKKCCLLN